MLSIKLLGPLEIEFEGASVLIPGRMTQALLVRLALSAGSVVPRSALVDALWGDNPPSGATNALQVKVSELRRVIGPERIVARRPGYLLDIDPEAVDAFVASALIARGRRGAEDDPVLASRCYADALAMWRGDALSSVADSPFARAAAVQWHELRMAAFEERVRLELAGGRQRQLIAQLEAAVEENPLREPLVEVLMLALAADGRQVAALAAYRDLRVRLVAELGLDPSPRLQIVERQVLQQDPTVVLSPPSKANITSLPEIAQQIVLLPHPVSSFVSRDDDVLAVQELLMSHRLVTITGPGGVGKSRLAIEVARRHATPVDGVWFVGLEAVPDMAGVPDALANSLRAGGLDPAEAVERRLRNADLLLVLDNCEHLGAELAVMLEQTMRKAPGVRCLATSQRSLGISGEAQWPLLPLPRPAAIELFVTRAREVAPRVAFDDPDTVDRLCAQLDDLPLAIELAAGRCGVLSVQEVTDRLLDRFALLRDEGGSRAPRQQTLEATISWSYELLFPDSQLALQAITACSGGASFDGFEAMMHHLAIPKDEILDLVTQLVDRSLIVANRSGSNTRYTALEGVRSFGLDQAHRNGRSDALAAAHAAWALDLAHGARWGVRGPDQPAWLAKVRDDRANIEAALSWLSDHAPNDSLTAVGDLYLAWMMVGDSAAGSAHALRVVAACEQRGTPSALGRAEACAAQLLARSGPVDEALVIARRAHTRMTDAPQVDQVEVTSILGRVLIHAGRFEEGCDTVARSAVSFAELGDAWGVAMAQISIGWAHFLNRQPTQSVEFVTAAIDTLGTRSDGWITHSAHRLLGQLALEADDSAAAVNEFTKALTIAREMGSVTDQGQVLASIAAAHIQMGARESAVDTYRAAQHASRLAGDHVTLTAVQLELATLTSGTR